MADQGLLVAVHRASERQGHRRGCSLRTRRGAYEHCIGACVSAVELRERVNYF